MRGFQKEVEKKSVPLSISEIEDIGDKIGIDVHSFQNMEKVCEELTRLMKDKNKLPCCMGIHSKIDRGVGHVFQGFGVDFYPALDITELAMLKESKIKFKL